MMKLIGNLGFIPMLVFGFSSASISDGFSPHELTVMISGILAIVCAACMGASIDE